MSYQYLVHPTTAANTIYEVCAAIWNNLFDTVLSVDFTQEKWMKISDEFKDMWDFPHCIGAIDGKHILIQVRSLVICEITYFAEFDIV